MTVDASSISDLLSQKVDLSGTGAVAAVSGARLALFPNIAITDTTGGTINVTLSMDSAEGTLSLAGVSASVYPTLIQRSDLTSAFVTLSGTAAQVQSALSAITLQTPSGLTAARSGTYQLVLREGYGFAQASGKISIAAAPILPVVSIPATTVASGTGSTAVTTIPVVTTPVITIPVITAPVVPAYTQVGSVYTVGSDSTRTATIGTGTTPATVTGGAASLDFTGGNAVLNLVGTGTTTVHSLGNNSVNVGVGALHYVSGGNSNFYISSGTFDLSGGAATDTNTVVMQGTSHGSVTLTNSGLSHVVLFGGTSDLHYIGGNGLLVLNGAGMTGNAVIDSTGGNFVWGGVGNITYHSGGVSTLILSGGEATVSGGAATAATAITVGSGGLTYNGAAGSATIHGGAGFSEIHGGSGSLKVDGGNSVTILSSGAATVTGGGAGTNNIVYGGSGKLTYQGGSGSAVVTGGSGSDTIHAGAGGGWFGAGTGGNSYLQAGSGGGFLQGAANGDELVGSYTGNTWMQAGAGNETLVGGNHTGTVNIKLGSGADAVFLHEGDSVVTTGTGTSTVQGGGGHADLSVLAGGGALDFVSTQNSETTIHGFRAGTDHVQLDGSSVTRSMSVGTGTVLSLSNGSSITLTDLQHVSVASLIGH